MRASQVSLKTEAVRDPTQQFSKKAKDIVVKSVAFKAVLQKLRQNMKRFGGNCLI